MRQARAAMILLCSIVWVSAGDAPDPVPGKIRDLGSVDAEIRVQAKEWLKAHLARISAADDPAEIRRTFPLLRDACAVEDAQIQFSAREILSPYLAGRPIWIRNDFPGRILKMRSSPDGILACGARNLKGWLSLIEIRDGKERWTQQEVASQVERAMLIDNGILTAGRRFAGNQIAGCLSLHDPATGKERWTQKTPGTPDSILAGTRGILVGGTVALGKGWLGLFSRDSGQSLWILADLPGWCAGAQQVQDRFFVWGGKPGTPSASWAACVEMETGTVSWLSDSIEGMMQSPDILGQTAVFLSKMGLASGGIGKRAGPRADQEKEEMEKEVAGKVQQIVSLNLAGGKPFWSTWSFPGDAKEIHRAAGGILAAGQLKDGSGTWASLYDLTSGKAVWTVQDLPPVWMTHAEPLEGEILVSGCDAGSHVCWSSLLRATDGSRVWLAKDLPGYVSTAKPFAQGILLTGSELPQGNWAAFYDRSTGKPIWKKGTQDLPGPFLLFELLNRQLLLAGDVAGGGGWAGLYDAKTGSRLWENADLPSPPKTCLATGQGMALAGNDWITFLRLRDADEPRQPYEQ